MNHSDETNKIVGETPISDSTPRNVADFMLCRRLERELNAANEAFRKLNIHTLNLVDRIRRLEEAGDAMERYCDAISAENWLKAKEASK